MNPYSYAAENPVQAGISAFHWLPYSYAAENPVQAGISVLSLAAEDLSSLSPAVFTGRAFYPFDGAADPGPEDREGLALLFEVLLPEDFPDAFREELFPEDFPDDLPGLFPDDFREEPFPDRFLPEAEGLSGYREAS